MTTSGGVVTYNAFGVLTLQEPWMCDCGRFYRWARPAVWKRTGRFPRLVAVLAAIRDMLIPSGDEPTYVLNGWTCDCGREYERDGGDLLCCDWVTTADWTPVFTADPEPDDDVAGDRDDDWGFPTDDRPCLCGARLHMQSEHRRGPDRDDESVTA